jgi:hypothetical protein
MTTFSTQPESTAPAASAPPVLDRLAGGDDEALEQAFARLETGLGPAELLALTKGLIAIGLPRLAGTLLTTVGRPMLEAPGGQPLATAAAALLRSNEGVVPAPERAENARRNRAACPAPWPLDRGLAERIVILRDRAGREQLAVAEPAGGLRLIAAFRLRIPESRFAEMRESELPVIGMEGVAQPWIVAALVSGQRVGQRPAKAILFETDPLAATAFLEARDLSGPLRAGAIECRFGPGAAERYLQSIDGDLGVPPLLGVLRWRPGLLKAEGMERLAEESADCFRRAEARLAAAVRERYAGRGPAHWRDRFRAARDAGVPLRIVGIASRHTAVVGPMMRNLLDAFASLGHDVRLLTERDGSSPQVDVTGPFATEDFDLAVVINYLRRAPRPFLRAEIPYVCWLQDQVATVQTRDAAATQGPLDLLVTHSPGFYEHCFGYPRGQSLAAPNVTSWATFGTIGEEPRRSGGPDIVYFGHGSEEAESLAVRLGKSREANQVLLRACHIFRERLAANDPPNGFERMRITAALLGGGTVPEDMAQSLHWSLQSVYDRLFRHQALGWAAAWCRRNRRRLVIHGQDWERHPVLGEFAGGVVENGAALGELARDAGVVLHVNGNASMHQRLLDGLAAGGCVLTRHNPADFVPQAWRDLQRLIAVTGVDSLAGLARRAAVDPAVADAIGRFEATLGCSLAPRGDPDREADCATVLRTGFWPPDTLTDAGLFGHIRVDSGFLTPHGAADLAGFGESTFRDEAELGRLLDRVLSTDGQRDALRLPMREAVRRDFTVEALATRILAQMTLMAERAAG